MPVEVKQEELDPCRVALDVQVPVEQFQQTVDRVFHQMAKRTQVPGFRPGKAPRRLLERYIDQGRVNEIALERVVSEGYRDALQQTGLRPYGDPDLKLEDLEEGKPVSFRVTIPLHPKVELGEYQGLTFRRMQAEVTDENVSAELEGLRQQGARYEDVDEPAQEGDRVLATVEISVAGEVVPEAGIDSPTWLQLGTNLPAFDEGLVGATAGEKTFTFTYPDDFAMEERRGKQAEAKVDVTKVQRRVLPELDDAFAQSVGYDNLEALRAGVREQLDRRAAVLADSELEADILREVVNNAHVHFPEEMVTQEVADDIAGLVRRLERNGLTLERYLSAEEMDLQQLEEGYAGRARARIANTLVMMRVAGEHELEPTDAEVEEEIARRAEAAGTEPKVMRRVLEEQAELGTVRNGLFYRKVIDFLKSKNTIEEKKA